jgi:hypothetical protein
VTENGHSLGESPGVHRWKLPENTTAYEIGSGSYIFRAHWRAAKR